MLKVLAVENDQDLNRPVCSLLNQNSYEAAGCLNAGDAYGDVEVDNKSGEGSTFTVQMRSQT